MRDQYSIHSSFKLRVGCILILVLASYIGCEFVSSSDNYRMENTFNYNDFFSPKSDWRRIRDTTGAERFLSDSTNISSKNADSNSLLQQLLRASLPQPLPQISDAQFRQLLIQGLLTVNNLEQKAPLVGEAYKAANKSEYPHSVFGKLIGLDGRGRIWSCTGEYVGHAKVLLTAAHCVYDQFGWRKNLFFAQQFCNGTGVIRRVKSIWLKQPWINPKLSLFASTFDYAFLVMEDPTIGGYLGFYFPDSYARWTAAGYPSNYGNAKELYFVDGLRSSVTRAVVRMSSNPFREGSSGGAWFAPKAFDDSSNYLALGINSFYLYGDKNSVYSPRFNAETYKLWQSAVAEAAKLVA